MPSTWQASNLRPAMHQIGAHTSVQTFNACKYNNKTKQHSHNLLLIISMSAIYQLYWPLPPV